MSTNGLIQLRQALAGHRISTTTKLQAGSGLIQAAVLIPLVCYPEQTNILFTKRTQHLRDHPGQVSFPGGRIEAGDANAAATALREAEEEVGISPQQCEILGYMPDYQTNTGFLVTPVVATVQPPLTLQLGSFEVAMVFEAPMKFLLNPAIFHKQTLEYQGRLSSYWSTHWQEHHIWGATAGMLVELAHLLASGTNETKLNSL